MTDSSRHTAQPGRATADLAFFGKVTASVTHELNNVISIIDQTAGLLGDLIAGEERGIPISTERLAGAAATIQRQTQRGLGIIARLNRFAHTADAVRAVFDLNDVVGNIVTLSERLAGLKRIRLEFRPSEFATPVSGSPFAFQHLVFTALQAVVAAAKPDTTILVKTEAQQNGLAVGIFSVGQLTLDRDSLAGLSALSEPFSGTVAVQPEGQQTALWLNVRVSSPEGTATPGPG